MRFIVVVLCCFLYCSVIEVVGAQNCKVSGRKCVDDEQCCGGCCFGGKCIDTYRSCLTTWDVCKGHSCYGEESCIVYVPPQCPGCDPQPLCRILENLENGDDEDDENDDDDEDDDDLEP